LFLSLPCFSLITACGTHSEVVGDSQITAIDVTATTDTKSMIKVEQETT
jgi:hypothetical protein